MSKEYQLMIDPTPYGFAYGFPRALPKEAVMGKGSDLWVSPSFDLTEWVVSFGYPEADFQYFKTYPELVTIHDKCGTPECCGECTPEYDYDVHGGGPEDFSTHYK